MSTKARAARYIFVVDLMRLRVMIITVTRFPNKPITIMQGTATRWIQKRVWSRNWAYSSSSCSSCLCSTSKVSISKRLAEYSLYTVHLRLWFACSWNGRLQAVLRRTSGCCRSTTFPKEEGEENDCALVCAFVRLSVSILICVPNWRVLDWFSNSPSKTITLSNNDRNARGGAVRHCKLGAAVSAEFFKLPPRRRLLLIVPE